MDEMKIKKFHSPDRVDIKKSELLACDCCGLIRRPPFAVGDSCLCGYGEYQPYYGDVEDRGLEFAKDWNEFKK